MSMKADNELRNSIYSNGKACDALALFCGCDDWYVY